MVNVQSRVCIRDKGVSCEESMGDDLSIMIAEREDLLSPRGVLEQSSMEQIP